MCIFTTTKQKKEKFVFKKTSRSYLSHQLYHLWLCCVISWLTHDLRYSAKGTYTVCPACHFTVGVFLQCVFALFTWQPVWPCMDVWYPHTTRKQRLLAAPAPSTLDILVSSRWWPPILDLPKIQHSRKFQESCFSRVASFQLNQQMPASNPSLNVLSPSRQGSASNR